MLIHTFKQLLGSGRAWRLTSPVIRTFSEAFVEVYEKLRIFGKRLAFTPFLTQNIYVPEDEKEDDCENYEELFGIENIENKTLEERQQQAEAQWGLSGGQGWKYLENVFNNAGLKCKVIENIPVKDLGKQGYLTFGSTVGGKRVQYGGTINEKSVQYGGWKYRLVANGDLNIEGINKDPVKVIDYSKAVLIEFLEPVTSGKYDNFVKLFLQIKPAEVIALVKVNIY